MTVIDSMISKKKARNDLALCKALSKSANVEDKLRWKQLIASLERRQNSTKHEPTEQEILELVQFLAILLPQIQDLEFESFSTSQTFKAQTIMTHCTITYDPPCQKIDFYISHYHKLYLLRLPAGNLAQRKAAQKQILAYIKRLNTVYRAKL